MPTLKLVTVGNRPMVLVHDGVKEFFIEINSPPAPQTVSMTVFVTGNQHDILEGDSDIRTASIFVDALGVHGI